MKTRKYSKTGHHFTRESKLIALAFLSLALFPTHRAIAATATSNFSVTATVNDECTISSSNLNFGVYSIASGTPSDSTSNINVICTNGTSYNVSLDGGSQNNINARKMQGGTNPSNLLSYQLYSNSGRTTVWGNGTTGSVASGSGSGSSQSLTVYGRIPASQAAAPDSYSDTIAVTLTY